jgi:hypothetical protein
MAGSSGPNIESVGYLKGEKFLSPLEQLLASQEVCFMELDKYLISFTKECLHCSVIIIPSALFHIFPFAV